LQASPVCSANDSSTLIDRILENGIVWGERRCTLAILSAFPFTVHITILPRYADSTLSHGIFPQNRSETPRDNGIFATRDASTHLHREHLLTKHSNQQISKIATIDKSLRTFQTFKRDRRITRTRLKRFKYRARRRIPPDEFP